MLEQSFDLQAYMTKGVENIVKDALRSTLKNPRETAYLLRFAAANRNAAAKRASSEKDGTHIPPFLIASITSSCNLHCAGCYSRCNEATNDETPVQQLSAEEWGRIFGEASALGISFILLAGGEPLLRRDIMETAGQHPGILFPIFTNGTYMDRAYFELFDRSRNLLPVLSIEGGKEVTDARRGRGVYDLLVMHMAELKKRDLPFGASVTVTKENLAEVMAPEFVEDLRERGLKALFYVEYVPMEGGSEELAPGDEERARMQQELLKLREQFPDIIMIAFPGDEKATGGCVAAGRGFFHINSHGGAEPCPFSPFSDVNVRDTSLLEALRSPLFLALQEGGLLDFDHVGGCALNEKRAEVTALLSRQ